MAAVALCLGPASAAMAAPSGSDESMVEVAENGRPGLLSLTSSVFPLTIPTLSPGEAFSWQIGLHLAGQPAADGSLEFIPHGGLTRAGAGYVLTAQRCETTWTGHSGTGSQLACAAGATPLVTNVALEDGPTARIPVGHFTAGSSPHIRFTLTRPHGSIPADSFTFALGFTVMGDDQTGGSSALPNTGTAGTGLLAAAAAFIGAGLTALFLGRKAGKW